MHGPLLLKLKWFTCSPVCLAPMAWESDFWPHQMHSQLSVALLPPPLADCVPLFRHHCQFKQHENWQKVILCLPMMLLSCLNLFWTHKEMPWSHITITDFAFQAKTFQGGKGTECAQTGTMNWSQIHCLGQLWCHFWLLIFILQSGLLLDHQALSPFHKGSLWCQFRKLKMHCFWSNR